VASSFGYGPVSKLLAVARALGGLGYELSFIGRGPALELASHFPFARVYPWEETNALYEIEKECLNADGVVNVMEPRLEALLHKLPVPHFYIDSLFWMWSRLNPWLAEADIYFIQNFPGVTEKVKEWRVMMRNPQLVGPVVDIPALWQEKSEYSREMLINFGGLESGAANAEDGYIYAGAITRLMLPLLTDLTFESVLFTGNKGVMAFLAQQFSNAGKHIKFIHCSPGEFIARLRKAKLLLSSPGLTTTYEAFLLDIPVRFLPPQNYSQTLMLDHYRQNGLVDVSLHWKDLYPQYQINTGLEVSEAIRAIRSTLNVFLSDRAAQEKAGHILRQIIHEPVKSAQRLRQKEFIREMGRPSPEFIASSIASYLR